GLIALLVAIVGWVGPAEPYQAPWAWISFIGMCIVDDFLLGSKDDARWGELPKVALLAAVIVFRRHPEITVLVAVTAAPLAISLEFAGVLLALAWRTPFMEPAALKVADGALVTVAGIVLGFVLGGRSSRVFKASPSLPVRPLLGAGAVLLLSQVTPSPLSW